ncbi:MAG: type II toxin-antitoxin system VapC family toxin [Candidatus Sulfotelmatobacter sp.]
MTSLVLDASVAVKWVIPAAQESFTHESLQLLKRHMDGDIRFVVPDVFWAEVGSVLWKGVRRKRWNQSVARVGLAEIIKRNFLTFSSLELLPEALILALAYERSIYDCIYVALAIQFRTEMITADERLANALAARLPVKWLGAF